MNTNKYAEIMFSGEMCCGGYGMILLLVFFFITNLYKLDIDVCFYLRVTLRCAQRLLLAVLNGQYMVSVLESEPQFKHSRI